MIASGCALHQFEGMNHLGGWDSSSMEAVAMDGYFLIGSSLIEALEPVIESGFGWV